jgi:hypothetical protein
MEDNLSKINFAEVLRDLSDLADRQPEGFTTREMVEATGRSDQWCRNRLRILISNGTVRHNGKKNIQTISGTLFPTNVYVIVGGSR